MLITRRQETRLWVLTLAAVVALLWFAPRDVAASKSEKLRTALGLKISGPSSFHYGDQLKFKAALTNRSAAPIVLAPANSRLSFQLNWRIMDPAGHQLKPSCMECPITGLEQGPKVRTIPLEEDDVHILMPGERIEYEDQDIGYCYSYSFPCRGQYQVVATYVFPVPEFNDSGDAIVGRTMFDVPFLLDLGPLSGGKRDALKHAVAVQASSNRWTMRLVN